MAIQPYQSATHIASRPSWANRVVDFYRNFPSAFHFVLDAPPRSVFVPSSDIFRYPINGIDPFFTLAYLRPDCLFVPFVEREFDNARSYLSSNCQRERLAWVAERILQEADIDWPVSRYGGHSTSAAETLHNVGIAWRVPSDANSRDAELFLTLPAAERFIWVHELSGAITLPDFVWGKRYEGDLSDDEIIDVIPTLKRRVHWFAIDTDDKLTAEYYCNFAVETGTPFFVSNFKTVSPEWRVRQPPLSMANGDISSVGNFLD